MKVKFTTLVQSIALSGLVSTQVFAANLRGIFQIKPMNGDVNMEKTFEFKRDGSVMLLPNVANAAKEMLIPMHGNYYVDKRSGNIIIVITTHDGKTAQFYKFYADTKDLKEVGIGEEKNIFIQASMHPEENHFNITKMK